MQKLGQYSQSITGKEGQLHHEYLFVNQILTMGNRPYPTVSRLLTLFSLP